MTRATWETPRRGISLKIFPAYGLENSLLTAILVGLYIRFFFNEWLGWVFSGLVVPGYLACIVLLRPASAAVSKRSTCPPNATRRKPARSNSSIRITCLPGKG